MKKIISIVSIYALPVLVLAAEVTINTIFDKIKTLVNSLIPIIIAAGVVWFLYNVVVYMISRDEEKKGDAKSHMIYGIIGLFVMVSFWGLVNVLENTFTPGLDTSTPDLPKVPSNTN